MKNSVLLGVSLGLLVCGVSSLPNGSIAQNYQRVTEARMTPAPRNNTENSSLALNGQEAVPYSYGYSFNMPNDSKWRYIGERCFGAAEGTTCVSGHWIRRVPGRCEETTAHNVRRGNYIQIIPAGPVPTCRN